MDSIYNKAFLPLLSDDLREELIQSGQITNFQNKQFIHQRGEKTPGLSIILSGMVRFGVYIEDGSYVQTSVLGAGHCFGEVTLFTDTSRAYDADALGQTSILQITKSRFEALVEEYAEISKALLTTLTTRLYEALEFADDLRALSPEARIRKLLIRLTASGGFKDGIIPVRQIDIAYALGLSRVSVGKALTALQEQDVLRLGYREITLLSFEKPSTL